MSKFIVIPDSFKGTLSSAEICTVVKERILNILPKAQVITLPVADGGEGSVDCLLTACGGKKVKAVVKGPYFEDMDSFYGVLPDGTAVIEMAACAGLPLVGDNRSAADTTTYGVGQLMAHALRSGCRKILLCLGGSATNDGGCGMAAALGVRFVGAEGKFVPTGRTIKDIEIIDAFGLMPEVHDAKIIAMCDINNPLFGFDGAAYVFAPQKGVKEGELEMLDENLRFLDQKVQECLGVDAAEIPGAGAAGGMGYGAIAFLGAQIRMGIETVLDTVKLDEHLPETSLVITGEGKIDSQSLRGKVVIGVARRAKKKNIPVVAIVGDIGDDIDAVYSEGVNGIFSINRVAVPYQEARQRAREDLARTIDNLILYSNSMRLFR